MKKRFLATLLCVCMVLTLLPTVAFAAPGDSEANPYIATTLAELKAAMEDSTTRYIKIDGLTETTPPTDVYSYFMVVPAHFAKTLILAGASTIIFNPSGASGFDSLIEVNTTSTLNIIGTGSLTTRATMTSGLNAVIRNENGTVNVYDGVTLAGSYNNAVYGRAIAARGGTTNIYGGIFIGTDSPGGTDYSIEAVHVSVNANMNVYGGLFWANGDANDIGLDVFSHTGTLNIYEGFFERNTLTELGEYVASGSSIAAATVGGRSGVRVAPPATQISSVALNVTKPVAGATPATTPITSATTGITVSNYSWRNSTTASEPMATGELFVEGESYFCLVDMTPNSEYEFAGSLTAADIFLDNGEVAGIALQNTSRFVFYTKDFLGAPPLPQISSVALTVTAPVAGASPTTAATSTTGATVSFTDWTHNGTPFTGTFVAGETYRCGIVANPNSGYTFAATPTATINGNAPTGYTFQTSSAITCYYDFVATADASTKLLVSITNPAAITGVANGTAANATALGLPTNVTMVTDGGNVSAPVTWDVASSSYNPATTTEQTFTVNGTVTLPSGVVNTGSVLLTASVSVTVDAAPPTGTAPTITTSSLPNGEVGTAYSQTLTATGSTPITWTVDSGSLPDGLTLSGNTISGTPTTEESQTFTIKASNTTSDDTQSFTIVIAASVTPPTTYTVSYNANGGTGTMPTSAPIDSGDPYTIAANLFSRSGYTFNGWRTAPSSGTNYAAGATISSVTANITLYAQWTDNGGGSSSSGSDYAPSVSTPSSGTSSGWSSLTTKAGALKDGDTMVIDMKGTTTVPSDFLKAIAGKDVDVTFDMGSGLAWTVTGTDIPTSGSLSSLNLGVSTGGTSLSALVKNINGTTGYVQLNVTHNGNFQFPITLTATLDKINAGYFANLYYYNETTKALEFVTASKVGLNGTAAFLMKHASTYAIVVDSISHDPEADKRHHNPSTGADISPSDWFYEDVIYVYSKGLMVGISDSAFGPQMTMTRGMIVTVLGRLAGIDTADYTGASFDDVTLTQYYAPYIKWAAEKGIVSGIGDNKFAPDANISRQDLAVILNNYANKMGITLPETATATTFSDDANISGYAKEAVEAMQKAGIISGKPGNLFDPKGNATRAEVAAILHRFCETVE